jgi:rhodanese-related sulfurtransferase
MSKLRVIINKWGRWGAMVAGVLVTVACQSANGMSVSLEQARQDLEQGKVVMIDVREQEEHATGVAAGALLIPMSQIEQRLSEIPTDTSRPVYVICNTQNRSSATLNFLRKMPQYQHLRFVEGGMSQWAANGWPLIPPK